MYIYESGLELRLQIGLVPFLNYNFLSCNCVNYSIHITYYCVIQSES